MIFKLFRYLLDFIALCVLLFALAIQQGYGGAILRYIFGGYWNYYVSLFSLPDDLSDKISSWID